MREKQAADTDGTFCRGMARPEGSAAWRVSGLSCGRGVIKGGSLAHLAAPGASRALSPWNMTLETCDPGATCGKQRPAPPSQNGPVRIPDFLSWSLFIATPTCASGSVPWGCEPVGPSRGSSPPPPPSLRRGLAHAGIR